MLYKEAKEFIDRGFRTLYMVGVISYARQDPLDDSSGFVGIAYVHDSRLKLASQLMSNEHAEFAAAVSERLGEFAGVGGEYEQKASALISQLADLEKTWRIQHLQHEVKEHEKAAEKARHRIRRLIQFNENNKLTRK